LKNQSRSSSPDPPYSDPLQFRVESKHLNPGKTRLVIPKKGQSVLAYPWSSMAGGWYWGSQKFAGKLRKLSEKRIKERKRSSLAYRKAPQVTAHDQEQAERWPVKA
jgi:hypothetical protein